MYTDYNEHNLTPVSWRVYNFLNSRITHSGRTFESQPCQEGQDCILYSQNEQVCFPPRKYSDEILANENHKKNIETVYAHNSHNLKQCKGNLKPNVRLKMSAERRRIIASSYSENEGDCRITKPTSLGNGNFRTVYKCKLDGLKREITRKKVSKNQSEKEIADFLREVKIVETLDPHLNLFSMVGSCEVDSENNIIICTILESSLPILVG